MGYTNDVKLAADYTRDVLCENGIMPGYGQDGDTGGFNGICVRWLVRFMKDCGKQEAYQNWLQHNADATWKVRRPRNNLAWAHWSQPPSDGQLMCMQVVPLIHDPD